MKITRRAVLKALGVSPMAAPVLAQQLGTMAAGGAGLLGSNLDEIRGAPPTADEAPRLFHSVASWWEAFGKDQVFKETKYVTHFDADILSFHLPLQTKVAFQRRRNFECRKEERLREMGERILKNGFIKWWK